MKMTPSSVRSRAGALSALGAVLLLATSASAQQKGPRITPNFKDADITQLIEAVSAATGKNFIIDPRVRAQVTWLSGASTALTPEQFYQGFLSVLQVHGFIAVPAGNIIKVLPDANMRQIPGDDLPNHVSSSSDDVVTQVIAVSNVSAAQMVPVLRPLMPQNAQLSAVTGANMLIISDRASNVSRMMRIVARIDQSGGSDIDVIPLQSATAADTVRVLSSLVAQGGDAGLVLALDLGRVALAQHSRPVGGRQHQLEAVGYLLEAVFNGDAGHGLFRFSGDVEGFEGSGPGSALGRELEPLGVNDGLEVEQRALE